MCYMAIYTRKMQAWLDTAMIGPLQPNISVTLPVTKEVSTDHLYETTYRGKNEHVTNGVTMTFQPFKVIRAFGTSRKRTVCDMLLVRSSNLGHILHRFQLLCVSDPNPIPT